MKTERRHELKHNDLADWIAQTGERLRPYATGILGVVLALVMLVFVYVYLQNSRASRRREAIDAYYDAYNSPQGLTRLDEIARQYPSEPAGVLAQLAAADRRLDEGTRNLFTDRATARDQLRKAVEGYEAARAATEDPFLKQMALWGAARSHEALGFESPGDLRTAVGLYNEFAKTYPQAPLAVEAKRRVADLQRNSTLEFYDWFARVPVSPPPGQEPLIGDPGSLEKLPEGPEIEPAGGAPPAEVPQVEKPAADSPSTDAPPSDPPAAPSEQPPASEPPATP